MPETGADRAASAARSLRCQHKRIADALIARGHASRAGRLAELSRLAGRPVAAFAALSLADATAVLIRLGLEAGRDG